MNNTELVTVIALSLVSGLLGGYLWGVRDGEKLGRDKEWMDSFFRSIQKDKARRDRLGRFHPKTK